MINRLIPSGIRDRLRPYRILLQESCEEISFLCQRADRKKKRAQLEKSPSNEELFAFAKSEFWVSQNEQEILAFLQLLQERSPRVMGEIGTFLSGNCFLFSRALTDLRKLIAIDLKIKNREKLLYYAPAELQVQCINGFSSWPATLHQVRRGLWDDQFDAIFIDGDHEYVGARADLLEYSQMVRPQGLIAFHDIVPDHLVNFGRVGPYYAGEVYLLWRQLKRRFRHWEFIADPGQSGAGIGVIECDPDTPAKLRELSRLDKHAE